MNKVIITGSLKGCDSERFFKILKRSCVIHADSILLSQGRRGIEKQAVIYAEKNDLKVVYYPHVDEFSMRSTSNKKLCADADCMVLIWDGKSLSNQLLKLEMQKLKKPIFEVIL